ncbi:tetA [Symbiodinium natans]|uniref:TetA protein n=1 Tax=Symbiodinium natans TaxID=878477 RepID=A0A812K369_9DINO|nr:tetA [Symbiodinium natans]
MARILVIALVAGAFVSFLQAKAATLAQMLVVRAIGGIASSSGPVETAYLMEETSSEQELREVLVLQRIVVTLGAILGPVVAKVFSHLSFQDLCYLIVASNLVGSLIAIFFFSVRRIPAAAIVRRLMMSHGQTQRAMLQLGVYVVTGNGLYKHLNVRSSCRKFNEFRATALLCNA